MDSLSIFMKNTYIQQADSRIPVKLIYEDFRSWFLKKYDITAWSKLTSRQIYAELKILEKYPYVRYKEGYCLKGITYKTSSDNKTSAENITIHKITVPKMTQITMPVIGQSHIK